MQTFNAAILLVFSNIGAYGGLSVIERFALLTSFIPLTKFFKSALMNLGSGADAVSDKSGSAFSNLAAGVAIGGLGAIFDGKTPKGGKPQGSGSSGSGGGYGDVTSGMVEVAGEKQTLRGTVGGLVGGAVNKGKEVVKNPKGALDSALKATPGVLKETAKLYGKAAAGAAAVGTSMGSAATGGSALIGTKALVDGFRSGVNQVEGLFGPDAEDPITMQGFELANDGFSGFSEGTTMFSKETRNTINADSGAKFNEALEKYNTNPVNAENPVEPVYNDTHDSIIGVKIPGVAGKTIVRKDEQNKVIASESTFVGKKRLDNFKNEVLDPFVPKK